MKNSIKALCILLLITSFSCFNEEVDLSPLLAEDEITVDSELYNNLERVTDDDPENNLICIDFDYVFTLNVYNEEDEFIGIQIVGSDLEFSTFLESLQDGYSISVSYPITSTTEDGETIEINNNDDLQAVIESCLQEEVIGICNGLLTEEDCIWRVIYNEEEGANNDFENAIFDVSTIGTTTFTHDDVVYNGTWITFFIEDELHLNINLDDDATVAEHWNFDWKNTIVDENNMILENDDGLVFYIQRECEEIVEECAEFEFEECELNQDEGIAEFFLEDYIECLANFIEYEITENTIISFHVTQIDAESNTNAIPTDSVFLNTLNPQFLFARFEDTETMEVVYTSLKLTAIDCEE